MIRPGLRAHLGQRVLRVQPGFWYRTTIAALAFSLVAFSSYAAPADGRRAHKHRDTNIEGRAPADSSAEVVQGTRRKKSKEQRAQRRIGGERRARMARPQ